MTPDPFRQQRAPYERFALPQYADRDPAHNADHIRRILARLDHLAQGLPPPRPDWLFFLACFHGLGRRIAQDAAFQDEVQAFLTSLGWSDAETTDILAALDRHTTRPVSVEERIVHDANAVEMLGAFGIAKAFTTGGARGQSYEQTVAIYERILEQARFTTPAGQALAAEGRAYARAFLDRLTIEATITKEPPAPGSPMS